MADQLIQLEVKRGTIRVDSNTYKPGDKFAVAEDQVKHFEGYAKETGKKVDAPAVVTAPVAETPDPPQAPTPPTPPAPPAPPTTKK